MVEVDHPSKFFAGGSAFAEEASRLPQDVSEVTLPYFQIDRVGDIPYEVPLEMTIRPGLLRLYMEYTNRLIDEEKIIPAYARLRKPRGRTKASGRVINPVRNVRPIGGESPFEPGNEHMTPPALLEIRERGKERWLMRVIPNLFANGNPTVGILEDTPTIRREIVPVLSLVVPLNLPAGEPVYDMTYNVIQFMKLLDFAVAKTSRLIQDHGVYLDRRDGKIKPYEVVIPYANFANPESIKKAGGSVVTPHIQISAYPPTYAPPIYDGLDLDEQDNCDRCYSVGERLKQGVGDNVLVIRDHAVLYQPETELPEKGEAQRVAPLLHIPDWETLLKHPDVLDDMVDLQQRAMRGMTLGQGDEPALNVIWAQGDSESHIFTHVRSGVEAGGSYITRAVFTLDDGTEIRPSMGNIPSIKKYTEGMPSIYR